MGMRKRPYPRKTAKKLKQIRLSLKLSQGTIAQPLQINRFTAQKCRSLTWALSPLSTLRNPRYDWLPSRSHTMAALISTFFWDKKIKIAILTVATFAALC